MHRSGTGKAFAVVLALTGLVAGSCDKITARPTAKGRFAYLYQTTAVGPDGSPGTQVRLAKITVGLTPPKIGRPPDPKAQDVGTLLDTATKTSPTDVNKLVVSPLNTRLLVYSSEVPINALDQNLQVWKSRPAAAGRCSTNTRPPAT